MAQELYRFFDSGTDDERSYDASELAAAMQTLSGNGVADLADGLQVTAEGGTMRTLVSAGRALINGYFYELREDGGAATAFTHATCTGVDRVDRIVLRLDKNARTIGMLKREGTAAASPQPPALTRTDSVYELSLAQVHIRDGATAILTADVTDERADESVCGAALPEAVKLSTLWKRMPKQNASASAPGLMSAADKTALDALHAALTPDAQESTLDLNGYRLQNATVAFGEGDMATALGDAQERITSLEDDEADTGVHLYTHSRDADGVHHFDTADGVDYRNGCVQIAAQVQAGDTFKVNGVAAVAYSGANAVDSLPIGRWTTFVFAPATASESAQINFKQGSNDANGYAYVVVSSASELPQSPTAPQGKVLLAFITTINSFKVQFGYSTEVPIGGQTISRTQYEMFIVMGTNTYRGTTNTGFWQSGIPVCPIHAKLLPPTGTGMILDIDAYTWNGTQWTPWSGNSEEA